MPIQQKLTPVLLFSDFADWVSRDTAAADDDDDNDMRFIIY